MSLLADAPAARGQERALEPSPVVRLVTLGDRAALFSERTQQLHELNAAAELIWRSLARDEPLDLEGVDVAAWAEAWVDAGYLLPADIAARARGPADAEMALGIADLSATLALHGVDPAPYRSIFGQFAAAPAPGPRLSLVDDGDAAWLLEDGAPRGRYSPERLLPEVKAVLTDYLSKSVGGGAFLIHAALLARQGRGLLITGQPGAGKTTLTLALAAAGFAYASDDIVRLSPDGRFEGVPFSPASKSGAWELAAPYVPGILGLPVHLRADGQRVRYVPVGRGRPVTSLGWVLTLDRQAGAEPTLDPVEPLSMLTELLASAFSPEHRLTAQALDAFAASLARARCFKLTYSDLPAAVAALEALTDG